MLGSDCHNTEERAPNLALAAEIIIQNNQKEALAKLKKEIYDPGVI